MAGSTEHPSESKVILHESDLILTTQVDRLKRSGGNTGEEVLGFEFWVLSSEF